MGMEWIKETLGTEKPVIAMCHLLPLPGDSGYDEDGGMEKVVERARREYLDLQEGGVDAVMFSNEFSLPYLRKCEPVTAAAMARVIGELKSEIKIPFGVNVLWDPMASLDLAAATGAKFIREIMSGVYASDFGLWDTNTGEVARHQVRCGARGVRKLFNIVPESSNYLGTRPIELVAKTTVFNCAPDAICVSGQTAGSGTDMGVLDKVKNAIPETPVFANTGCRVNTIEDILKVADGCVVGTTFKKDGKFENAVVLDRVKEFMDKVHSVR